MPAAQPPAAADGSAQPPQDPQQQQQQQQQPAGQQIMFADSIESLMRNVIQKQKIDMANEVIDAGSFDNVATDAERRQKLEAMLLVGVAGRAVLCRAASPRSSSATPSVASCCGGSDSANSIHTHLLQLLCWVC
jgi:hypothetical protein